MPTISEEQLSAWTKPAFNNEDQKRSDTERMIREAIKGHALLRTLPVDVYAKGSYRNNTNVRRDSDVDVAVEYTGIMFSDYGPNTNRDEVWRARNLSAYDGPFRKADGVTDIGQFKDAVGDALVSAFGSAAVTRSNKVFTVRESTRSLAADVVPSASYRHFFSPASFNDGIRLLPDRFPGHHIHNYPQQHYDKGVQKNENTSRRYKCVVRILKNLENRMVNDGASPVVASYLIESLVFNTPNQQFSNGGTWGQHARNVLGYIWEATEAVDCEKSWTEANDIKYLFHVWQKWNREEARAFVHAAWQYVAKS
jgi:hypothetical protein